MRNFKLYPGTLIEKLSWGSMLLFSISILLPENYRNIPLFMLLLTALLGLKSKTPSKAGLRVFIVNGLLYLILALSLLYTGDLADGFKRITVMASIGILPFALYTVNGNKVLSNKRLEMVFYWSFLVSVVIFYLGVFVFTFSKGFLNSTIFEHFTERLNSTLGKYSLHPLYASLYICISICLSVHVFTQSTKRAQKLFLILCMLFLTLVLLMLARKGAIFFMLILAMAYFFIKLRKTRYSYIFVATALLGLIFSYYIEPIRLRYVEFFQSFSTTNVSDPGSTSFRLNVYKCALKSIFESPIFGYGLGDTKHILTSCYVQQQNMFSGLYFNSHNQFLSVWLAAGIFGFLALVYMMYSNIQLALKSKSFLHASVIVLFLGFLMIENILERQDGVILFSFFINFFAFKNLKHKPTVEKNTYNRAIS